MGWQYLELADYLLIAEAILGVPAERLAEMPRVTHLAGSALAVPASGFGGHDAYPEFAQKAGLLAARLIKNHALPDGNKRVAWLAMIEFSERNGYELDQPEVEDAVQTMFDLAAGRLPEADFVDWLRPRLRSAKEEGAK